VEGRGSSVEGRIGWLAVGAAGVVCGRTRVVCGRTRWLEGCGDQSGCLDKRGGKDRIFSGPLAELEREEKEREVWKGALVGWLWEQLGSSVEGHVGWWSSVKGCIGWLAVGAAGAVCGRTRWLVVVVKGRIGWLAVGAGRL